VAVQVQRDSDLGMPEPFAGNFWMDALAEQVGRMGAPQIMEPDTGQGSSIELAKPILGDGVGLQRRAVSLCYHECIIREANADLEKLLSPPQSMGVVRAIPPQGWPTGPVCDSCRSWASCSGPLRLPVRRFQERQAGRWKD
jgi:hypothetical protein